MPAQPPLTKRLSFSKEYRLRTTFEFNHVFKRSAKPVHCDAFVIRYCANTCGHPRLGLAISRKAAGNAVQRNKVRRLAKESFRHHIPQLAAVDFVVIGKPKLCGYSPRELAEMLNRAWSRCAPPPHAPQTPPQPAREDNP